MGSGKINSVTSKTVLTDEQKREIVERFADGATWVQLAREYRTRFYKIKAITEAAAVLRGVVVSASASAGTEGGAGRE